MLLPHLPDSGWYGPKNGQKVTGHSQGHQCWSIVRADSRQWQDSDSPRHFPCVNWGSHKPLEEDLGKRHGWGIVWRWHFRSSACETAEGLKPGGMSSATNWPLPSALSYRSSR